MKLSVAYITFRIHPHFQWFAASLARELKSMPDVNPADVQIIVIDGRLWYDSRRGDALLADAAGRIRFEHHPPKPSPWQGPDRQTNRDYFCAAAVRNTALAYARGSHVLFVDDLSVLLPGWLKAHVHAATHGYVLAGTTCKQRNIAVDYEGNILSFEAFAPGRDSRIDKITEDPQNCPGGWLFGGTFSVPTWLAMATNGQDEIHDTIGGEDYDFGIRLERAGAVIRISRGCGTYEAEADHHAEPSVVRLDKPWPGPDGPYSSNYLLKKLEREASRCWTTGNDYVLRDVRSQILVGGRFPEVSKGLLKHWVDGRMLREM